MKVNPQLPDWTGWSEELLLPVEKSQITNKIFMAISSCWGRWGPDRSCRGEGKCSLLFAVSPSQRNDHFRVEILPMELEKLLRFKKGTHPVDSCKLGAIEARRSQHCRVSKSHKGSFVERRSSQHSQNKQSFSKLRRHHQQQQQFGTRYLH